MTLNQAEHSDAPLVVSAVILSEWSESKNPFDGSNDTGNA